LTGKSLKLKIKNDVIRPRSIEGKSFQSTNGYVDIADLHFWEENPRIFSLLDEERATNAITKDVIFRKMILHSDFDKLKEQIRKDGHINEPIWVSLNPTTNNYTVYEGNTRLAVAIQLSQNDMPDKRSRWTQIEVNVLPDGTDESVLKRFIGVIHLIGKNKWQPFEADGYYFREVEDAKKEGLTQAEAFAKVAESYVVSKSAVTTAHKMISFMNKNNMSVNVRKSYYSYWKTVTTNKPLQKVRKIFNEVNFLRGKVEEPKANAFDEMLIKKIIEGVEVKRVSGSSDEGTAFRDDIKLIAEAHNENGDVELICDLLNKKVSIEEAVNRAKEGGIGDAEYERVAKFADWLCASETMRKLQNAVINYPDLANQVKAIETRTAIALMKLKREEE